MKVLFDVNVIIDVWGKTEDFAYSFEAMDVAIVRNDVDVIVTRNKRDFAKSPVPALTPEEFVSAYKPVDMEYELVEF